MFSFYRASKRAIQQRDDALTDRNFWRERCLKLERKLEERSDHFIEREFKLIDRFLTSSAKTYAISDEIRASKQVSQADVDEDAWLAYRADKIEFLAECLREGGVTENVMDRATHDFEANEATFRQEFQFETL